MVELKEKTWKVLSYCDIPEEIVETASHLKEVSCDTYVEYGITPKEEQAKYSGNFTLTNWILEQSPDLAGHKILIHIDY